MEKRGNAYGIWLENRNERNCLEDLAAKQEDNIKIDLKSLGWFELVWLRIVMSGGVP